MVGEAAEAVAAAAKHAERQPSLPPPLPPQGSSASSSPPPTPLDRERLVELVQHLETLLTSSELERIERVGERRPAPARSSES